MQIDFLTSGGRQTVIDRFNQNAETSRNLHNQLERLQGAPGVKPVIDQAMRHLRADSTFAQDVTGQLLDLETSIVIDATDDLGIALVHVDVAREAAISTGLELHTFIMQMEASRKALRMLVAQTNLPGPPLCSGGLDSDCSRTVDMSGEEERFAQDLEGNRGEEGFRA